MSICTLYLYRVKILYFKINKENKKYNTVLYLNENIMYYTVLAIS